MSWLASVKQRSIEFGVYQSLAPLIYRDFDMTIGFFLCDKNSVAGLCPQQALEPVAIIPGRCLVAVSCMQYRDTDIGPYNEVALSLPLQPKRPFLQKGRALLSAIDRGLFHAHVLALPVNTKIALTGGQLIFNYPKIYSSISFDENRSTRRVKVDALMDIEFQLPHVILQNKRLNFYTYPVKNGVPLKARFEVQASKIAFGINGLRPMALIRTWKLYPDLKLGMCLQVVHLTGCEGVLYEPEEEQQL